MPVINVDTIQNQIFRLAIGSCNCHSISNVVVTPEGIYSIDYTKNGGRVLHTGKILSIVKNPDVNKAYILFDCSDDRSGRKERIYFYQINDIKDITPNDAYRIALQHGFEGTVEEWLESMRGPSPYDLAVRNGYQGTEVEWLESLKGMSAYDLAVQQGFEGTLDEWLSSIGVDKVQKQVEKVETRQQEIEKEHLSWIFGMD